MPKKGYKQSDEHKIKKSLSQVGTKRPPRTEQWKLKQKISHLGKHHSEETKIKIGNAEKGERHWNYGKQWSTEIREKMSLSQKGKPKWNDLDKKKMSKKRKGNNYCLGKHWTLSNETRIKQSEGKKGEKSYLWKGGISSINRAIRGSVNYRLWREAVFARDEWTCQKTKSKGGRLHPHHINNFSQFPELRFVIENGITLSEKSHKEFHDKYGKQNNTESQLKEFLCQS